MNVLTEPIIDRLTFRDAMSHFASAVHLVTTDGPGGLRGATVTSVCSVSDDPATLLVCLNLSSPLNALFVDNGVFAVNVLPATAERLARAFAGEGRMPVEERFALGQWTNLATGSPILEDALASFDCRLTDSRIVATHRILIGEVASVRIAPPAASLVYKERQFHIL